MHIHHGLVDQAGAWAEHCRDVCAGLGIPFHLRRVTPKSHSETAAREARYGAFAAFADPGDNILTGHHREDQAETVLMNLLRGSGVKGLAGIPQRRSMGTAQIVRPLLATGREQLRAIVVEAGLTWIEDPTNQDDGVRRNQVRRQLLAICQSIEPAAIERIVHSAALCREASRIVESVAADDVKAAIAGSPDQLAVGPIVALPVGRRREAIRSWLRQVPLPPPPGAQLNELERQLGVGDDREVLIQWPGAEVRRYRDGLYASAPLEFPDADANWSFDGQSLQLAAQLGILEWLGDGGAPPTVVRFGCAGQSIRLAVKGSTRRVKKLFQEAGIPPWERRRTPFLFSTDGALVAVADRWLDFEFASMLQSKRLKLIWRRDQPEGSRTSFGR